MTQISQLKRLRASLFLILVAVAALPKWSHAIPEAELDTDKKRQTYYERLASDLKLQERPSAEQTETVLNILLHQATQDPLAHEVLRDLLRNGAAHLPHEEVLHFLEAVTSISQKEMSWTQRFGLLVTLLDSEYDEVYDLARDKVRNVLLGVASPQLGTQITSHLSEVMYGALWNEFLHQAELTPVCVLDFLRDHLKRHPGDHLKEIQLLLHSWTLKLSPRLENLFYVLSGTSLERSALNTLNDRLRSFVRILEAEEDESPSNQKSLIPETAHVRRLSVSATDFVDTAANLITEQYALDENLTPTLERIMDLRVLPQARVRELRTRLYSTKTKQITDCLRALESHPTQTRPLRELKN